MYSKWVKNFGFLLMLMQYTYTCTCKCPTRSSSSTSSFHRCCVIEHTHTTCNDHVHICTHALLQYRSTSATASLILSIQLSNALRSNVGCCWSSDSNRTWACWSALSSAAEKNNNNTQWWIVYRYMYPQFHGHNKHNIGIKYHYIREQVNSNIAAISLVNNVMLAPA